MKRYLVWTTALTGGRDGTADIGPHRSRTVVSLRAPWLHAAVELAENEKFDCNLGFSHYSLNAVAVFFFCLFSGKELKHSRRARRRAALQLSIERTRWGAPGALGRGEVNSYWQAMRTTATLHFESAFAFNHVRDWDSIAKLLMSNTIGLPLDLDLGSTETGLMYKTSHNNFTWVLTKNKHALSPCSLKPPPRKSTLIG